MGADTAAISGAPRPEQPGAERSRTTRLAAVGELVRLYEDLERALARTGDGELADLVTASRHGERELGAWARRLEEIRGLKRRFEAAIAAPHPRSGVPSVVAAPVRGWAAGGPTAMPFVWEAVAFVVGFAISFVLT